jgi:outer membrane protein assembly factor BamB
MKSHALLAAVVASGLWTMARGEDWPQWRGPDRNGISQEKGLLAQWPEAGPKLLWQLHDIGDGYSTPAVVGERLYLMSNRGMDDEFVAALNVKDGSKVWTSRVGKVGVNRGPQYPGARSTPTVDGQRLYALGSDGDLVCLDTATGGVRWQKSLRSDFAGQPGAWAYAESPLVDGDVLVVTPGGSEATIVALNKQTGAEIWRCATPEKDEAAYASTIIVEAAGAKQYVQFLQKGLAGVDARTGKLLWRYAKTAEGSPANIPTPVAKGDFIYSSTGRGGSGVVQLKADGSQVTAEEVYYRRGLPSSIGGSVVIGDHLYGTTGQALVCADFKTGGEVWTERAVGASSVVYADGRLYFHTEKGDVMLVEATPDAYREKGSFTLPDQPDRGRSQAWAYPVIANGRLYLRDLGKLWCYDVRAAQAGR